MLQKNSSISVMYILFFNKRASKVKELNSFSYDFLQFCSATISQNESSYDNINSDIFP